MKHANRQLRVFLAFFFATLLTFFCVVPALAEEDVATPLDSEVSAQTADGVQGTDEAEDESAVPDDPSAAVEGAVSEAAPDDDADGDAAVPSDDETAAVDDAVVPAADEVAAEVADDAVVEEDAAADEIAPADEAAADEAAPAEAPMTLMAKSSAAAAQGHWEVTASRGHGLQRYWIEADGSVAKNRLIDPAEGSGWWAYARPEGYVVRGKYTAKDGKVYLANNDGKLENPGWVVTNKYDGGMQRYWIDAEAHAAVPGYSSDGWDHYTRPEGYVSRGKYVAKNGYVYLANNDGKLEKPGWVVTAKYDGGYQRYWIDAKSHAAIPGYSEDGWYHYTIPGKGYVARGVFTDSAGKRSVANNDGKILSHNGWLVTNAFGHGLQRYWFRNGTMAAGELLNAAETGWWAYARPEGFVVRGKYVAKNGYVYLANNDGRLENPGWVVTNKYDGGYQRYYIEAGPHAAVPGFSKNGWAHYTLPNKGYVARGRANIGGYLVFANNDGKITSEKAGWLVTSKLGDGMQRYWIEDRGGYTAAKLGLFTVSGKQYYGIESKGYVLRNDWRQIGSSIYNANNDGVLSVDNTYLNLARRFGSSTNYVLLVDNTKHRVAIFTRSGSDWALAKLWVCSVGKPSSPTVRGVYYVGSRGYAFGDSDHTCYYWTQIHRDWLFHSVLYVPGSNMTKYRDDRLGYSISGGCVRLAIENAKWIHDNVTSGSTIYSF